MKNTTEVKIYEKDSTIDEEAEEPGNLKINQLRLPSLRDRKKKNKDN